MFQVLDQHTAGEPIHLDLRHPGSAGQPFDHELGQVRSLEAADHPAPDDADPLHRHAANLNG